MAKAASPVRLQKDLMDAATLAGDLLHRSAAEQIEYWADLGRKIARFVDPDKLLEIQSGLAHLKVVPNTVAPINADDIFSALEARRRMGELSRSVTTATPSYQASITHPGYLEQIDKNDHRTIGMFQNGVFTPIVEGDS